MTDVPRQGDAPTWRACVPQPCNEKGTCRLSPDTRRPLLPEAPCTASPNVSSLMLHVLQRPRRWPLTVGIRLKPSFWRSPPTPTPTKQTMRGNRHTQCMPDATTTAEAPHPPRVASSQCRTSGAALFLRRCLSPWHLAIPRLLWLYAKDGLTQLRASSIVPMSLGERASISFH